MLSRLSIFKLLTPISFLLVPVFNEEGSSFMGRVLLLQFGYSPSVIVISYCVLTLAATFYLLISAGLRRTNSIRDDIFSLFSIMVIYVPFCIVLPDRHWDAWYSDIWVWVIFISFGVFSITTFLWTLINLIKKTTANKRIAASEVNMGHQHL
jgi:hypothetical protein